MRRFMGLALAASLWLGYTSAANAQMGVMGYTPYPSPYVSVGVGSPYGVYAGGMYPYAPASGLYAPYGGIGTTSFYSSNYLALEHRDHSFPGIRGRGSAPDDLLPCPGRRLLLRLPGLRVSLCVPPRLARRVSAAALVSGDRPRFEGGREASFPCPPLFLRADAPTAPIRRTMNQRAASHARFVRKTNPKRLRPRRESKGVRSCVSCWE